MTEGEPLSPLNLEVNRAAETVLSEYVGRELTPEDVGEVTNRIVAEANLTLMGTTRVIELLIASGIPRSTAYRRMNTYRDLAFIPVMTEDDSHRPIFLESDALKLVDIEKQRSQAKAELRSAEQERRRLAAVAHKTPEELWLQSSNRTSSPQ